MLIIPSTMDLWGEKEFSQIKDNYGLGIKAGIYPKQTFPSYE